MPTQYYNARHFRYLLEIGVVDYGSDRNGTRSTLTARRPRFRAGYRRCFYHYPGAGITHYRCTQISADSMTSDLATPARAHYARRAGRITPRFC